MNINEGILNGKAKFSRHLILFSYKILVNFKFRTTLQSNLHLQSLKMFLLPFLATLIIAIIGHASGEETLPISLLAEFGTIILHPVKKYCQELGDEAIKYEEENWILCESANALDKKFFDFGKIIMKQMNIGNAATKETGHTMSATIETLIEESRLAKPTMNFHLVQHYHKFVTDVGKQIVDTMTGHLHAHIVTWIGPTNVNIGNDELYKEIEKKCKSAATKNGKLKSLENIFLKKVDDMKNNEKQFPVGMNTCGMQYVAIKINESNKHRDNEKQLAFFLDLFVANFIYIELMFPSNMYIAYGWPMRMTMEP